VLSDQRADGRCQVIMKVYSESNRQGHQNEQISGTIFLSPHAWHLVTFSHSSSSSSSSSPLFRCYVDSSLEMERDLTYPFQQNQLPPQESLWSFGAGLTGEVASVTLYPSCIPASLLNMHYEAGPLCPSLDTPVSHPQGSFDTGSMLLGTRFTKGLLALRASRCCPIFVFTALHFWPTSLLPYAAVGLVHLEHVEMSAEVRNDITSLKYLIISYILAQSLLLY
jgi:hypothetical protein